MSEQTSRRDIDLSRKGLCTSLLGLVAAATIPLAVQIDPLASGVLAEATVLLSFWGLTTSVVHGARINQLVFWAFTLSWLGVAPLYQLYVGEVAWGDYTVLKLTDAVQASQVLVLVSLVAFLVGSRAAPGVTEHRSRLDTSKMGKAAFLVIVAAGFLLPMAASASGGLANLFASRQERAASFAVENFDVASGGGAALGFVKLLPAALATVGCYFAVLVVREEIRSRRGLNWRMARLALVVAGLTALAIYSNPIANSRFISFAAILASVIAAWQPRTSRSGFILAMVSLVGVLFVYPIAFALRKTRGLSTLETFTLKDWAGPDFDGFQQWVNTVLFVEENGYSWGSTILSAMFFFVPRSIWPGKEIPASITIAESRSYEFTDLSLPVSAEFYLNFGFVGLVIGMFVLGRIWARLDVAWLRSPDSLAGVLAPLVATQQFGLVRGPLGSLAPVFGTVLILSAAVVLYSRRASEHERAGRQQIQGDALFRRTY